MKTFIRWAGSKKQVLGRLRANVPSNFGQYIEPFCGSASLFFDLEPKSALLGDLNQELICTLRAVQRDVSLVVECLRTLRQGKSNYYKIRNLNPACLSEPEVAARFIYLNHYCFNGLYRTNLMGRFNVPYGSKNTDRAIDENVIISASEVLQSALLLCGDFEQTIEYAEPGDFVYLDPPYAISKRRIFSEYVPNSFCLDDLQRLALCLKKLHKKGTTFLITYADSHEARHLLAPWQPQRIQTRRNIAGFVGARRVAYELLATNQSGD